MITSEVQRTLVKSPPELWSELSDPESLARHLGELGEVRITRTEPENLVEWEAEGTTGTVEIKPSGWGTRVTLTVSRELPTDGAQQPQAPGEDARDTEAPAGETDDEAEAASTEEAPQLRAAVSQEAGATESTPLEPPSQPSDPAGQAPPAPVDSQHAAPAPAAPIDAQDAEPPQERDAEHRPGPATEAARRAAGWPRPPVEQAPETEGDLPTDEAHDGPPEAPGGVQEWAAQALEGPREDAEDDQPLAAEASAATPEPRRGLFARLFGWRRRRPEDGLEAIVASGREAQDAPGEPASEDLDAGDAEPAPGAEVEELPLEEALDEEPEELLEPAEELELAAEQAPEPEPAPAAEEEGQQPAVETEPAWPAQPATVPGERSEEEPEPRAGREAAEQPAATTAAGDLSAELRAAEEVEAEQVRAVLTAVLDRLGSAHHRPFSRP